MSARLGSALRRYAYKLSHETMHSEVCLGLRSRLGFVHQYWYKQIRGSLCAGKASRELQGNRYTHVSMILLNYLLYVAYNKLQSCLHVHNHCILMVIVRLQACCQNQASGVHSGLNIRSYFLQLAHNIDPVRHQKNRNQYDAERYCRK